MTTDDHGGKGREGGEEDVPCGTAASWRLRRICGTMGVFVRRPGAYITGRCKARSGRVWHTERWRFAREGGRVWHTDAAVVVPTRAWPGVAHGHDGWPGRADARHPATGPPRRFLPRVAGCDASRVSSVTVRAVGVGLCPPSELDTLAEAA